MNTHASLLRPDVLPALPQSVYRARRQQLLDQLPEGALMILPAANLATRSRDTEYPFRQSSDFWYLTGYQEPEALLVLCKGRREGEQLLFNQPKDKLMETWTGIRLGQEAAISQLGVDQAFVLSEADQRVPLLLAEASEVWLPLEDEALYHRYLGWRQGVRRLQKRAARLPDRITDLSTLLGELRLIKQPEEIELLREAARISAEAHCRAMRNCRPGMYEYQLQAEIEHEFMLQGGCPPAYGSIVGAGDNACVLHYVDNRDALQDGDLVLIDAGAEFQGYAGDITRIFPVNGRFSLQQKQLYQLVLQANELAISLVRPGTTLDAIHQAVVRCLVEGLVALDLLQGEVQQLIDSETYKTFFMHGTSHWLGLDVHDAGLYRQQGQARALQPGMVFTIEPGLYIAPDQMDVDSLWRGIGIRIEDDVLVTEEGCEVLTQGVPKSVEGIETLMAGGDATD
ncbi:Xaa-Pro aminopeptidase [Marinospirillum alkaliphilum]|uniref:Xaa-Pro aminopeptidase n=1 Tax=Marinospirillum alkaliphilum DSM 21637 TaxID=1122209 RepID=A0A1K1WQR8_9GAMM|nr:Xaa-Pro aminopeptidase [Marinospirillum alkaliphilum]SFX39443.1 aminopeptidase P . Metallo peptidase. MEROPS family M24B [Marinospirillum alkaliphilum DSM 21637]